MTNAELIQKIRNEIERQLENLGISDEAILVSGELSELLSFLDTIESEKPIPQDELEKEINRFRTIFQDECDPRVINEVARHFAQWGAEHAKIESEKPVLNNIEEEAGLL